MRENKGKRRRRRPGEDGPDDSLDALLSSYTPRQREKVLKGLRILARVAIRSYMEERPTNPFARTAARRRDDERAYHTARRQCTAGQCR